MDRTKVEDTLLAIGIPAGIKGFNYIMDAMDIFEERGTDVQFTKELYPNIADKRSTTSSRVERGIRHAFECARNKGDAESVQHYIGMHNANSHSLRHLYMMLQRE